MDISLAIFFSLVMLVIGTIGVLIKRNALILFLSIELILNASNLLFIAFSRFWGNLTGMMWVFFVLVVAAAEAAIGLAIIVNMFHKKPIADIDQHDLLKESHE